MRVKTSHSNSSATCAGQKARLRNRRRVLLWGAFLSQASCFQQSPAPLIRARSSRSRACNHRKDTLWFPLWAAIDQDSCASPDSPPIDEPNSIESSSRRTTLRGLLATSAAVTTASLPRSKAWAGKPEIDASGELFSPRTEMMAGGTSASRGVPLRDSDRAKLKAGQALQTVYETRFIAYMSRFLLSFDPAAHSWWIGQGFGETWEERGNVDRNKIDQTFSEFAESLEVGLADYFVGPYGSYSSLSAAKAGLLAAQPAPSVRSEDTSRSDFLKTLLFGQDKIFDKTADADSVILAKQGVLNLCTLLKARYSSVAAKRQLAILFSFISSPRLQPTKEIRGLLGETDNATLTEVILVKQSVPKNEIDSRTSPRRGGGYGRDSFPTVMVDGPPALGSEYKQARLRPIMKCTSRILRIRVTDGGEGYLTAPQVSVVLSGFQRLCQATAILDRQGRVDCIVVLDPGYGYFGRQSSPPKVTIEAPKRRKQKGKDDRQIRPAKAVADLEYQISGVEVVEGGTGYVKTEPPAVVISPPDDDPDWFLAVQEQPALRMEPVASPPLIKAVVSEMKFTDGNVAYSLAGNPIIGKSVDGALIDRLQRDPLELLPSSIRPVLLTGRFTKEAVYIIPSLARIPQTVAVLSPRFRAQDPVFGGVGKLPVTKGAAALKPSEYGRLALSGAICTVLVRTALNPLELVKTKQQLQNDDELMIYARSRSQSLPAPQSKAIEDVFTKGAGSDSDVLASDTSQETARQVAVIEKIESTTTETIVPASRKKEDEKIGTLQMVQSMIELRGTQSIFQSADITFLASLVFGSFGFGATELFRRSFSLYFINEGGGDQMNEIAVLLAASLATVITAAAASPFEVLRVRSMGLLEEKKWTCVLQDYLIEKSDGKLTAETFAWTELRQPSDWFPLWSGFAPIVSRELPFAVVKFLVFDLIATAIIGFINSQTGDGALPVQVGIGPLGLTVSAASGAVAGIAGAIVSHPADLILTKTSSTSRLSTEKEVNWRDVVKDLISQPGGLANLYVGFPARATFFFLVIGLQFFLYDYVKTVFEVGSDDLNLVLDVFYAVREGLVQ